jgi:hypothetical protein
MPFWGAVVVKTPTLTMPRDEDEEASTSGGGRKKVTLYKFLSHEDALNHE